MPVTVTLFCEEIDFLENIAKESLKENFIEGWFINPVPIAMLNVKNASEEQKKVLLRRLGGYNPKIVEDKIIINLNEILDF